MHLVDADRLVRGVRAGAVRDPLVVAPGVRAEAAHDGGGARRMFGSEAHRIRLLRQLGARRIEQVVLVDLALVDARNERLPHARRGDGTQGVSSRIPRVEGSDDCHPRGVRRPHGEVHARGSFVRHDVCAEHVPEAAVGALGDEVAVELAEDGGLAHRADPAFQISVMYSRTARSELKYPMRAMLAMAIFCQASARTDQAPKFVFFWRILNRGVITC